MLVPKSWLCRVKSGKSPFCSLERTVRDQTFITSLSTGFFYSIHQGAFWEWVSFLHKESAVPAVPACFVFVRYTVIFLVPAVLGFCCKITSLVKVL